MWGRRRAQRVYDVMLAETRESLAGLMETADDTHRILLGAYGSLCGARDRVEELLGQGDGLPAKSVRAEVLDGVERLWGEHEDRITEYEEMRAAWRDGVGHADIDDMEPAVDFFAEFARQAVPTMEAMHSLMENLGDLQRSLRELRDKIAPIQQRAHAAFAAASAELAWTGPTAPGKFALEARLHSLGDRLHELDAGRVELQPGRTVMDWYHEVEAGIAEIRDATVWLGQ
ncbi:hypothetical protein [Streptomyces sp. UNOB3_S3]|uniref:hypothetical protein n=1 Tax=Streptomyces sp. UNOB3_S3 TaxID=2871682 RepID=UPI001E3F5D32|nr:hypothetical protein [Streptomyces sp. UNOB3_S3]MCC3776613.1 hypothetical protein [Streptomyces sp. UNOB3_S3]